MQRLGVPASCADEESVYNFTDGLLHCWFHIHGPASENLVSGIGCGDNFSDNNTKCGIHESSNWQARLY